MTRNFADHLRYVSDQCPLPGSSLRSLRHTNWYADGHASAGNLNKHTSGYTQTVFQSRLFGWYRTFSSTPPARPKTSLVTISEWIPEHQPAPNSGWTAFGPAYTCAYARLHAGYLSDWRSHAKKHLKAFLKAGCELRLGTRQDVVDLYAVSQVPKSLQTGLLGLLDRHLAAHPETIEILVATKAGKAIACLVSGNCEDIGLSEYLIGAFHPDYKLTYAMVGLTNWWYQRSLERGYKLVSFGRIEPPGRFRLSRGAGYSFFKTHFGVQRLWFPGNHWRVFINI